MVKRKLPKSELRRHIKDTPFTRDEVQRLWDRFNHMDGDGSGLLNYQVDFLAASALMLLAACRITCFCLAKLRLSGVVICHLP